MIASRPFWTTVLAAIFLILFTLGVVSGDTLLFIAITLALMLTMLRIDWDVKDKKKPTGTSYDADWDYTERDYDARGFTLDTDDPS